MSIRRCFQLTGMTYETAVYYSSEASLFYIMMHFPYMLILLFIMLSLKLIQMLSNNVRPLFAMLFSLDDDDNKSYLLKFLYTCKIK